ncbi:MAG: ABC transporter permease [Gemmatimonadales bacterium]
MTAIEQHDGSVEPHITIVRPAEDGGRPDLKEAWEFRELLYYLVWRSIKVRYKQTVLGASWAVLQPLLTMLVLSVFLGRLARVPSGGIPYPLFAYAGLVVWTFFTSAVSQATQSLVEQQSMITRVYFPRILLPLSGVLAATVDMLLSLPVLVVLMIFYGFAPSRAAWTLPLFLLLAGGAALGIGLFLSALNVRYRDVRYAIPFIIQLWFLSTPVMYPSSLLPHAWRLLYGINPMAGVIEGFRWGLFGTEPHGGLLMVSIAIILIALVGGFRYFRRMDATFADVV